MMEAVEGGRDLCVLCVREVSEESSSSSTMVEGMSAALTVVATAAVPAKVTMAAVADDDGIALGLAAASCRRKLSSCLGVMDGRSGRLAPPTMLVLLPRGHILIGLQTENTP